MLKRLALAFRNVFLLITLIIVVFGGGFWLYWDQTTRPIIVADSETFEPPADFPSFEVDVFGTPSPGRITMDMRYLPRNSDLRASSDAGGWDYLVEYDIPSDEVVFAQKAFYSALNFTRHSPDVLSYYEMSLAAFFQQRLSQQAGGLVGISGGTFVVLDGDYREIDRFGTPEITDFHELLILDNGNRLFSEVQYIDRSPSPEINCTTNCYAVVHHIIETDANGNRLWEWDSSQVYQIADLETYDIRGNNSGLYIDVVHANGIAIDSDGNLLVSMRNYSDIVKIDRRTGDVIWHLGGMTSPYNQFTFIDDPLNGFSFQHQPTLLDNGNLLLFDNGNQHQPSVSRAVEYAIDEEAMTATLIWEYVTPDQHFSAFLGSAQRLPNGNTLISFTGRQPSILEVTPDGDINMEITLRDGFESYRVNYYPWDIDCDESCRPGTEP